MDRLLSVAVSTEHDLNAASTALITFTGIVIVFLVLFLLILVLMVFNAVAKRTAQKTAESKKLSETEPVEQLPESSAPIAGTQSAAKDNGEIIAAISAAVYASLDGGDGKNYKIKSIKRANTRSPWAAASVSENTRPF